MPGSSRPGEGPQQRTEIEEKCLLNAVSKAFAELRKSTLPWNPFG
ncbi:MAG TPA: hypothetical protein VE868_09360 [Balneolaceae bacterium]|nr:hypothetical protein [Balneolaceae bacterium]